MYGYVALHWSAADDVGARVAAAIERRITAAKSWELAFADPGLHVFHRGANRGTHGSIRLAECGTVLGTIFRSRPGAGATREFGFSERVSRDIQSTNGKYLVSHY